MIRFGIAGFGHHAVRRLMPGFALAARSTVSALSRRSLENAQAAAKEYGIAHAFDSVEALCACPEVDAVFVASPDALHLRDVEVAARHRKPILVEKPMGQNAEQVRAMIAAATAANVPLGVAHIFRFAESVRRVRERVAAGDIGRVLYARSEFCYQGKNSARAWIDDPALACGGPLGDVGVHCLDTLRFILGDEVAAVKATIGHDNSQLETTATMELEFRGGAIGLVAVSSRAEYRTPLEIVGETGALGGHNVLSVETPVTLELRRGLAEPEVEQLSNAAAYAQQVDAFSALLLDGTPFPAMAEEGLRNQLVLDAAYRSARTGHRELIEDERSS